MDLLGLLKWRSNTNLLQQNLRQLMKVDGGEVVKVSGAGPGRGWGDYLPSPAHTRSPPLSEGRLSYLCEN